MSSTKSSSSLWRTFSTMHLGQDSSPLASMIDVSKFGGALILTSAMDIDPDKYYDEDFASGACQSEHAIAPGDDQKPKWLGSYNRAVHGTQFRRETLNMYQQQSILAVELLASHLSHLGIAPSQIEVAHYGNDGDAPEMDPAERIRYHFRCQIPMKPDCLVYYYGLSGPNGEWAFEWIDADGDPRSSLVLPEDLEALPDERPGPPGVRVIVSDAPFTANQWMQPSPKYLGFAAWTDEAMAGTEAGPTLARWVTGKLAGVQPPGGGIAFPLPPDMGLRLMPTYRALYWGPLPRTPKAAGDMLWELQAFVGATTRKEKKTDSNYEICARGTAAIIVNIMLAFGAMCEEELLMRCVWLLHSMAIMAPPERWLGVMALALRVMMELFEQRTDASVALLAAVLDFAGAIIGRCQRARFMLNHGRDSRRMVRALAVSCLGGGTEATKRMPLYAASQKHIHALSAAAAARMCSQLVTHEPPNVKDKGDREMLTALQKALYTDWTKRNLADKEKLLISECSRAAAEALSLSSLRCQPVKWRLMRTMMAVPRFLEVLDEADAACASQMLALVRSLAVADPEEEEDGIAEYGSRPGSALDGIAEDDGYGSRPGSAFRPGSAMSRGRPGSAGLGRPGSAGRKRTSLGGTSAASTGLSLSTLAVFEDAPPPELPHGTGAAVVQALCKFPSDPRVQRWGLASLGALVNKKFDIGDEAAKGAALCTIWALGTDTMGHAPVIDQEALFCAHELLLHQIVGRAKLNERDLRVSEFVSNAVTRAAKKKGDAISMEVLCWGIKVLGLIAAAPGGPVVVAPFMQSIIDAMLSPDCTETTALAGASTLSIVVAGCKPANESIKPFRVRLVKSLQDRARTLPQPQRIRLNQWVQVICEAVGGYIPPMPDEEVNKEWKPMESSDEEDEVFPFELEKMAKRER